MRTNGYQKKRFFFLYLGIRIQDGLAALLTLIGRNNRRKNILVLALNLLIS